MIRDRAGAAEPYAKYATGTIFFLGCAYLLWAESSDLLPLAAIYVALAIATVVKAFLWRPSCPS